MLRAHGTAALFVALFVMMIAVSGCGLAYQAASEHRAAKMDAQLQPGMTPAQVAKQFGEPDIEEKSNDTTEIWSYAKHANSNDVTAELLYTSAKEGDAGTFEDLKFVDGKLASWTEAQHTMATKERSEITTTIGYGRGVGGGGRRSGTGPNASSGSSGSSGSSDSSDSSDSDDDSSEPSAPNQRPNPLSVTF
jgi:outer membrane protein assembly factor BamE (lipoprotein component of BamABCDE complex)